MKTVLLILTIVVTAGCALTKGRIKAPGVTVQGPKDGNNVSLAQEQSTGVLPLPAGSTLTVTKFGAVAWEPAINGRPEVKAQPAREVTEVLLSRDTAWRKDETKLAADTGTIDTTVATHRIDVAERRWLLFAAIGCGIAGLIARSMLPQWPAVSNGLLMAAVAAGAAWKLADIPAWLWLTVVGVSALLIVGYKRREKDERDEKAT